MGDINFNNVLKGKKTMLLMERIKHLSRRSLIRLASFATALVITLTLTGVFGYILAVRYRTQLEYTYSRALDDLSNYLDNINYTLQKEQYANTPAQISALAALLWRDAGSAKSCLAQLPVTNAQIESVYRFLSQVGDYSLSLSKQNAVGMKVSMAQRKSIESLSAYAASLSNKVSTMQEEMNKGRLWVGEVRNAIESGKNPSSQKSFSANLSKLSQTVTDYPTLVYDGPFSDHIFQQKPKLIVGKKSVSRADAKKIAASYMGCTVAQLADNGEENSATPAYVFGRNGDSIAITKTGGFIVYMQKSRNVDDEKLDFKEASAKALKYLTEKVKGNFEESYYFISDNVCTLNYAFSKDGVICYSDLIKVGVALDTGEIMSLEARGYVMNHYDRTLPAFKNTMAEARAVLSPLLKLVSSHKALITTASLKEVLCYEFICKGVKDEDVLVYVNAGTLQEEQIFMLIKTDGGMLTR